MNLFKIHTRNDVVMVSAQSREGAIGKYFRELVDKKVALEDVGGVFIVEDAGQEYPVRTAPLLWKLGAITKEAAVLSIQKLLNLSEKEAKTILVQCAEQDSRFLKFVPGQSAKQ
jgi:hypothetical protein